MEQATVKVEEQSSINEKTINRWKVVMNGIYHYGYTLLRAGHILKFRPNAGEGSMLFIGKSKTFLVTCWIVSRKMKDDNPILQLEITQQDTDRPVSIKIDCVDQLKVNALKAIVKAVVVNGVKS